MWLNSLNPSARVVKVGFELDPDGNTEELSTKQFSTPLISKFASHTDGMQPLPNLVVPIGCQLGLNVA